MNNSHCWVIIGWLRLAQAALSLLQASPVAANQAPPRPPAGAELPELALVGAAFTGAPPSSFCIQASNLLTREANLLLSPASRLVTQASILLLSAVIYSPYIIYSYI
jgi:hypothetical protein